MSDTRCRRCLLRELEAGAQLYESVRAYRAELPAAERTEDGEYARRLALCLDCRHLKNATCVQCGCFVELRAAKSAVRCPMGRW